VIHGSGELIPLRRPSRQERAFVPAATPGNTKLKASIIRVKGSRPMSTKAVTAPKTESAQSGGIIKGPRSRRMEKEGHRRSDESDSGADSGPGL